MPSQLHETSATVAAIILAGGASSRLGGTDKTRLPIAGASALQRVLRAAPVGRRIVVGPSGEDGDMLAERHGARFVLEDPPRSGPLAALERGVAEFSEGADEAVVLVLGGDMPMLRPETLEALAASSAEQQAVTALEAEDGQLQFLGAAWPLGRLRTALAVIEHPGGGWADLSLRRLYAQLDEDELVTLPTTGAEGADIDTPDALAQVRRAAGPRIALAQIEASVEVEATFETVRGAVAEAAEEGAHLVLLPEATLTPFGTDLRAAALAHHEDFAQLVQELAEEHGVVVVSRLLHPDRGRPRPQHRDRARPELGSTPGLPQDPSLRRLRCGRIAHRRARRRAAHLRSGRHSVRGGDLLRRAIPGTVHDACAARRSGDPAPAGLEGRARQARTAPAAAAGPGAGFHHRHPRRRPVAAAGIHRRCRPGIGRSAVVGPLGRVRQELGRDPGMLLVDLDLDEVEAARTALPVLRHHVELTRL